MGHPQALTSYTIYRYRGADLPHQYFNYVFTKWSRSYRYGNDYIKLCDSDSYFAAYRNYIQALLRKPDTRVRIAGLTDDIDVVLGFSVIRGKVLDYVYVHRDFRNHGIGASLVDVPPDKIEVMTHLTRTALKIWPKKLPDAKFNPFT